MDRIVALTIIPIVIGTMIIFEIIAFTSFRVLKKQLCKNRFLLYATHLLSLLIVMSLSTIILKVLENELLIGLSLFEITIFGLLYLVTLWKLLASIR